MKFILDKSMEEGLKKAFPHYEKKQQPEFTCKACGLTQYRQGFESKVCQRCNVPEYEPHRHGKQKTATEIARPYWDAIDTSSLEAAFEKMLTPAVRQLIKQYEEKQSKTGTEIMSTALYWEGIGK